MIPVSPDDYDALITTKLGEYQSQLEQGIDPSRRVELQLELPEECRYEFEDLSECIDVLNDFRNANLADRPNGDSVDHPDSNYGTYQIPKQIGRFLIQDIIGFGGFGVVYRGLDPEIGREVAIKIPRPELFASLQAIERFLHEAIAVSQLEHRNILHVYESRSDGDVPYIATPFIAGGSLSRWMSETDCRDAKTSAEIVRQLAEGMAHSHDRGVLHRDVKPANVLLAPIGRAGDENTTLSFVPKLTDFGLAKCLDNLSSETRTGTLIGTAGYMAPEQATGKTQEITARTDVYGLGCVLYELLTGVTPFRGENDLQTIHKILNEQPVSVRLQQPNVPTDLALICEKCLRTEPTDRYQTARALADDLASFLRGEPISARPSTWKIRIARWVYRHPAMTGLLSVAFSAVIALIVVSLWYNSQLSEQLNRAETAQQTAIHERELAKENELRTRRRAYVADMHNAGDSWELGDAATTLKLLDRHRPKTGEPDLRDFAWWYLWREYVESSRVIGTHQGYASAVAISPSGDIAASGGSDSIIKLWKLRTGELMGQLQGHERDDVTCLDFSPNGQRLVSAGEDGTIRVWNLDSRQELFVCRDHRETVVRAIYSPNGDLIASGGNDNKVRLWNPESLECLAVLEGHSARIRCLAFHPTEPWLFSGCADGIIRVWNTRNRSLDTRVHNGFKKPDGPIVGVRGIVVAPDGASIVVAYNNARIRQFSLQNDSFGGDVVHAGAIDNPFSLIWPRGAPPVFGTSNGEIRSADSVISNPKHLRLRGHQDYVVSVASSPDGLHLLSASRDGTVRYWPSFHTRARIDVAETKSDWKDYGARGLIHGQWCGPNLAVDFLQEEILIYRMPERQLIRSIQKDNATSFLLSPTGTRLILHRRSDGRIRCLHLPDGQIAWERHVDWCKEFNMYPNLAVDDSENYLLAALGKGILIVDLKTGEIRHTISTNVQNVKEDALTVTVGIAREQSGRLIAISTLSDGNIGKWDVESRQLLQMRPVSRSRPFCTAVAVSFNGELIAACGNDRKIHVLRLRDLSEIASAPTHATPTEISFLSGENTIVYNFTSLIDRPKSTLGIHFWNIPFESELLGYVDDTKNEAAIAVSPDGHQVALLRDGWIEIRNGAPGVKERP